MWNLGNALAGWFVTEMGIIMYFFMDGSSVECNGSGCSGSW